MRLTQFLLNQLNRPWDKDPAPFLAFRFNFSGPMTWTISDGVLTTSTGDAATDLDIDLAGHTLASLVGAISARPGYQVSFIDPSRADLSALVLLDSAGDPSTSNGDHVLGYTALLWAILEAYASELQPLADDVSVAPNMLAIPTAEGFWIDEIASFYRVPRQAGELDPAYQNRVIAEALRPRSNNISLAKALEAYTGQSVNVPDAINYTSAFIKYDGQHFHNGSFTYSAQPITQYGLFDVEYAYDLINGGDFSIFQGQVRSITTRLKSGGTSLRSLLLRASGIADSVPAVSDNLPSMVFALAQADSVTTLDAFGLLHGALSFADATEAQVEGSLLTITNGRSYNARFLYNGAIRYNGGVITSTIEGENPPAAVTISAGGLASGRGTSQGLAAGAVARGQGLAIGGGAVLIANTGTGAGITDDLDTETGEPLADESGAILEWNFAVIDQPVPVADELDTESGFPITDELGITLDWPIGFTSGAGTAAGRGGASSVATLKAASAGIAAGGSLARTATGTAARTATSFVQSIGVNTHLTWAGTAYADLSQVLAALNHLGISRIRDVYDPNGVSKFSAAAAAGIKMVFSVDGDIPTYLTSINSIVAAHPGSILAIEGPNEVNGWPVTYNGQSGFAGSAAYQRALYTAVKADSSLSGVPVFNLTVSGVDHSQYSQLGNLSAYCDYANVHIYYGFGQPWFGWSQGDPTFWWTSWLSAAQVDAPGKPSVVTESGNTTYSGGVNEWVQALQMLNAIMDAAKTNVWFMNIYELADSQNDPGNTSSEAHFGLYKNDWSPKIAAMALNNFTSILTMHNTGSAPPASLSYAVSGLPTNGGSYLLQQADGTFNLILWAEPDVWDESTGSELTPPTTTASVALGQTFNVNVYDPMQGQAPIDSFSGVTHFTVDVFDHPIILELRGGGGAAAAGTAAGVGTASAARKVTIAAHGTATGGGGALTATAMMRGTAAGASTAVGGGGTAPVSGSATWNPARANPNMALSNGNLTAQATMWFEQVVQATNGIAADNGGADASFTVNIDALSNSMDIGLAVASIGLSARPGSYTPAGGAAAIALNQNGNMPALVNGATQQFMNLGHLATGDKVQLRMRKGHLYARRFTGGAWGAWNGTTGPFANAVPETDTNGIPLTGFAAGAIVYPYFYALVDEVTADFTGWTV